MTTSPAKPPADNAVADFERSLDELERLVQRMEQTGENEPSLDQSLQDYERGVALYRRCRLALEQAQLRVQLLSDPEQSDSAEPFRPDGD